MSSIVESINKYLAADYEETMREYKQGLFHVSDLCNDCSRQTWYKYTIPQVYDGAKSGIFMRGDVYETWLAVEVLPKIFPDTKIERQIEMVDEYERDDQKITISGHADIGLNNLIVEVKTIGSKNLGWLKEPKPENVRQLNYYCWKNNKDGILIYLSPDTLDRKEFTVKMDGGEAQKLIDKAFSLDKDLKASKVSEPTIGWACNKNNRQGKVFCDFCQQCLKDGNENLMDAWKQSEQKFGGFRRW